MAVRPHPPSTSTNPRGGTVAIFLHHLSSWRQSTLPPTTPYLRAIMLFNFQPRQVFLRHYGGCLHCHLRHPISAPSCFPLSNYVRSSSSTPTNAVHLRVLPLPYLRRRLAWKSTVQLIIPHLLQVIPLFER